MPDVPELSVLAEQQPQDLDKTLRDERINASSEGQTPAPTNTVRNDQTTEIPFDLQAPASPKLSFKELFGQIANTVLSPFRLFAMVIARLFLGKDRVEKMIADEEQRTTTQNVYQLQKTAREDFARLFQRELERDVLKAQSPQYLKLEVTEKFGKTHRDEYQIKVTDRTNHENFSLFVDRNGRVIDESKNACNCMTYAVVKNAVGPSFARTLYNRSSHVMTEKIPNIVQNSSEKPFPTKSTTPKEDFNRFLCAAITQKYPDAKDVAVIESSMHPSHLGETELTMVMPDDTRVVLYMNERGDVTNTPEEMGYTAHEDKLIGEVYYEETNKEMATCVKDLHQIMKNTVVRPEFIRSNVQELSQASIKSIEETLRQTYPDARVSTRQATSIPHVGEAEIRIESKTAGKDIIIWHDNGRITGVSERSAQPSPIQTRQNLQTQIQHGIQQNYPDCVVVVSTPSTDEKTLGNRQITIQRDAELMRFTIDKDGHTTIDKSMPADAQNKGECAAMRDNIENISQKCISEHNNQASRQPEISAHQVAERSISMHYDAISMERDMNAYYKALGCKNTITVTPSVQAEKYNICISESKNMPEMHISMDRNGNCLPQEHQNTTQEVSTEYNKNVHVAECVSRAAMRSAHETRCADAPQERRSEIKKNIEKSMSELSLGTQESKFAYQGIDFHVTQPEPGVFHVEAHAPTSAGAPETSAFGAVELHSDGITIPDTCHALEQIDQVVENNIESTLADDVNYANNAFMINEQDGRELDYIPLKTDDELDYDDTDSYNENYERTFDDIDDMMERSLY